MIKNNYHHHLNIMSEQNAWYRNHPPRIHQVQSYKYRCMFQSNSL